MSIVIGLTGPTGSGKSSTAKVCRKYGIKTVDCDQTARKAGCSTTQDGSKTSTKEEGRAQACASNTFSGGRTA